MFVLIFLVLHWQASVFFQSFFLHRYAAHRQFTMSKGWERFFHLMTWLTMGASYLSPRAYAVLHRMHHAYSDTPEDPHSPVHRPFFAMMWRTHLIYHGLKSRKVTPERRFTARVPSWPLVDEKLLLWPGTLAWILLYTGVYALFATEWWMFLFLPIHFLLGPIHGGIVNYFGHKLGYRNFATRDRSKNTLVFDVLTMGELFQNNHHQHPMRTNFGARWFEIDPAFQIIRVLTALRIIQTPSLGEAGRPSASAVATS